MINISKLKPHLTFQESEKLEGPKFANFPSLEASRKNSAGFKLSPDMPFQFAGEDKEKKDPRIRFGSEEELRYQNDYFKLPELSLYDDYDDSISNELFPEFEAPKLKSKMVSDEVAFQRYAEPLSYMNPMDKFHDNNDVEMFSSASERTPAMAYKRAEPKYSHYQRKSQPHVETRPAKLSGQDYKPPKPLMHRATSPPDFPQDNPGFFKLPKLGPGPPGGNKGGFPRPPADSHLRRQDPSDLRPKKISQARVEAPLPNLPPQPRTTQSRPYSPAPKPPTNPTPKSRWTGSRPTPRSTVKAASPVPTSSIKAAWGPNDIGHYDYNDYYYEEQDYQDYYDYKDPPRGKSFPDFPEPKSTPKATQQRRQPQQNLPEPIQSRSLPDLPQSRTFSEPIEPRYPEPSSHRSFSKPSKSASFVDGSRENVFNETPESRSYEKRPQRSQVPAPLGPPPAILEMQHDSVFSAPFDVPKLGSKMAYTPPEVIYNEMHSQPRGRSIQDRAFKTSSNFKNNFNSLDPFRKDPRLKQKSTSPPTPVPFLPTPLKSNTVHNQGPFSEYGSIYDSPQKSVKKGENAYKSPKILARPTLPTFEEPPQDFFRPISAPSITFEPTPETYNEKTLHNLVAKELDSGNKQADVFLPFIEEENENFPPAPNQQLRSTLYQDYDPEPRYKRYQSVDYSPQYPEDYATYDNYNYEPQRFDTEDPFISQSPTPQPLSFDSEVASFLPPPQDFVPEHRSLPDFHSPDYYSSDYKGGDYYSPEYHTSDYSSEEYYPSPGGDYSGNYVSDYGSDFHQELDAVAPDFHTAPLGPSPHQPILSFGDKTDITQNSNQFINVASPEKFEHGHVRGNPVHKKQEYTRREGRQFKSQVSTNQFALNRVKKGVDVILNYKRI